MRGSSVLRAPADLSMSTADVLPGVLVTPMDGPVWLEDEGAVYAHGGGELWRLNRDVLTEDLAFEQVSSGFDRASGGVSVTLPMGATFVLAGRTADGDSVDTWDVFTPALPD